MATGPRAPSFDLTHLGLAKKAAAHQRPPQKQSGPHARRRPPSLVAASEDPDGSPGGRDAAARGKAARAPGGRGGGGCEGSSRAHWSGRLTDVRFALSPWLSRARPDLTGGRWLGPPCVGRALQKGVAGPPTLPNPRFLLDGRESGGAVFQPPHVMNRHCHVANESALDGNAHSSFFGNVLLVSHMGGLSLPS